MGVYHGFEKNETATMFFLKKPSLVIIATIAVDLYVRVVVSVFGYLFVGLCLLYNSRMSTFLKLT